MVHASLPETKSAGENKQEKVQKADLKKHVFEGTLIVASCAGAACDFLCEFCQILNGWRLSCINETIALLMER